MSDAPTSDSAPAEAEAIYEITIGVDGRLYCQDFGPALLPLLSAVCGPIPTDETAGGPAAEERTGES